MKYLIAEALPERDYELIDSGDGEKLERFGEFVTARPDPQALWPKRHPAEWKKADAYFGGEGKGEWHIPRQIEDRWKAEIGGFSFWVRLSTFKHVGVFPEHEPSWKWMQEKIKGTGVGVRGSGTCKILNLFGYTGGATLACAKAGAEVVHIDGSKVAIKSARDNAELSGLATKPIRWILEDAVTFVEREKRRGNTYDGIIMDPPAFGHGPTGEVWKIEEDLIPLVKDCVSILSDNPLFFLMNGYASGYSALAYKQILESCMDREGEIEMGELTIRESGDEPRNLPAGIFARWS
jgi:23S rRNA (cytosine1962-C5)-methyltransferase